MLSLACTQAGWYLTPINWHLATRRGRLHREGLRREGVRRARAGRRDLPRRPPTRSASRRTRASPSETIDGLPALLGPHPGQSGDAREPRRGHDHELHLGHDRQPQGREAPTRPRRTRARPDLLDDGDLPRHVRHPARGRQRPHLRLAPLPHRGADVLVVLAPLRAPGRADGQVGRRGDAAADRRVQVHDEPHGADPVPPHAALPEDVRARTTARRPAHGPRRGALPARREAPHARMVGQLDLRVLRGDRRRRHDRHARRSGCEYPGTVGKAWTNAEIRIFDDDGKLPQGEQGTVYMLLGETTNFEYKDDAEKTRRRTASRRTTARSSSRWATSAT